MFFIRASARRQERSHLPSLTASQHQPEPNWVTPAWVRSSLTFASGPAPAIIVFGLDPTGKPKAATFPAHQVDLATKAAGLMQLRLLKIDSPELTQFAAQLPVGKIYASGHGFVPQVRTAIYDRLAQFADPAPAPGLQLLCQQLRTVR